VFSVSGLWHGANWTFIIWGTLFGVIYIVEKQLSKLLEIRKSENFSFLTILSIIKTYILVTLIWVFFRSEDLNQVSEIFTSIFNNFNFQDSFNVDLSVWLFLLFFIMSDVLFYNSRFDKWCGNMPLIIRWLVYIILIYSIIVFAGVEDFPFIYFQF